MASIAKLADLNGFWTVNYTHEGPTEILAQLGEPMAGLNLILRDGVVVGNSNGGTTIRGTVLYIASNEVAFDVEVDTRFAVPDAMVLDPEKGPVRGVISHRSTLKVSTAGDILIAQGSIQSGPVTIRVLMRRFATLPN